MWDSSEPGRGPAPQNLARAANEPRRAEAFKLGGKTRMTQMALTDSDLEPLREWITLVATSSRLVLNNQRGYSPRLVRQCGETVLPSSQAA